MKHYGEVNINLKYNGHDELFWIKRKYLVLRKELELLIMAFPFTFLVEKDLTVMQLNNFSQNQDIFSIGRIM